MIGGKIQKIILLVFVLGISLLALPFSVSALTPNTIKTSGFLPVDGNTLIKIPFPFFGATGPAGSLSFGYLITIILQVALLVAGSIAVLFLIIGGFRYVTAHGNEEAAEGAKKTITHAILGIVIVVLSFAMIAIISRILILGTP